MKVQAENYKGIEFIRLSKLPDSQKELISQHLPADNVIKILKENELLTDCVQFKHYEAWYNEHFKKPLHSEMERISSPAAIKLAID